MKTMQQIVGVSMRWLKKNSSTILTFVGAAGMVGTVITAVKATPKATALINNAEVEKGESLTKIEAVKVAVVPYIPSIVIGGATLACIFGANILNQKHQAALVSAYALIDKSYKEYRNKVKELYGDGFDTCVKEDIARDKYDEQKIVKLDKYTKLYYDDFSGRYFEADEKTVIEAEYKVNRAISNEGYVTLASFYEMLGLPVNDEAYKYIGWTYDNALDWTGYAWLDFVHHDVIMNDELETTIIYPSFEPSVDYMDDFIEIPDEYKPKDEFTDTGVLRIADNTNSNL